MPRSAISSRLRKLSAKTHHRFDKADFIYIARDDEYLCSAGQRAIYHLTREKYDLQLRRCWGSACPQCTMKSAVQAELRTTNLTMGA
jgi:hypothetical protein